MGEHSSYARKKLDQLQEKLNNKTQALQALKLSLKPDNKVLDILAKEVEWLEGEKRQLEAHLNHTDMWAEHLGHWRADVEGAEVNKTYCCLRFIELTTFIHWINNRNKINLFQISFISVKIMYILFQIPENGEPPHFVLVVHMVADEADETSISSGWIVFRKLPEFQELHKKLRQLCPSIKNVELPSQPLKFFGKTDKNATEKAKALIQKYLNVRLTRFIFYLSLL